MSPSVVHTTTSNSTSVTIPSTTAGNTLVVCVMGASGSGTPSVSGVTLGGSSTGWAAAESETGASNEAFAAQWVNENIAGSQTAVVISGSNLDVASGFGGVVIYEVSGCLTSSALDKINKNTNTATSWNSGATGTLTQASEIAIGCCNASAGTIAGPSSPWTNATPSGGFAIAGYQVVSATTSLTYSGTCGSNPFPWASTIITLKGASSSPAGTVQPGAAVPAPRRKPFRALWRGITGQAYTAVPAPAQQPSPAPRRKPARAVVRFTPVTTVNAVPAPPVNGTVPPRAAVPVPRRPPGRAQWRGITGAAYVAVPAPRQQPGPAPRRKLARAIWRSIQGAPGPVYLAVPAPRQQYRTPPRRKPSRAVVQFTPVSTVNTLGARTLLISIASAGGTVDDYGNVIQQGVTAYGTSGQYLQLQNASLGLQPVNPDYSAGYIDLVAESELMAIVSPAQPAGDTPAVIELESAEASGEPGGFAQIIAGVIVLNATNGDSITLNAGSGPVNLEGGSIEFNGTAITGLAVPSGYPLGGAPASYSDVYAADQTTLINSLIQILINAGIIS